MLQFDFLNKKLWLITSLLVAVVGLSACTSDKNDTYRVIDDGTNTDTSKKITLTFNSLVPLNNVTATVYNLSDASVFAQATFSIDTQAKTQTAITKGLQATYDLADKSVLSQPAALLIELKAKDNTATYYDPVLDKTLALPSNKKLYLFTNRASNIYQFLITPFSDLAMSRFLARLNIFEPASNIVANMNKYQPIFNKNDEDIAKLVSQYNLAATELNNNFASNPLSVLNGIKNLSDLGPNKATDNPTENARSWVNTLVQFHLLLPNSPTPFIDLTNQLAIDFYDGDFDGQTLHGFGDNQGNLLTKSTFKYIVNPQTSFFYDSKTSFNTYLINQQKPTREAYQNNLMTQFSSVLNQLDKSLLANNKPTLNQAYRKNISAWIMDEKASYVSLKGLGVGNRTLTFGLEKGTNSKSFINADDVSKLSDITAILGKYSNKGCTLTVGINGDVTLKNATTEVIANVDRDETDQIIRTSTGYVLNVSQTLTDNVNQRQFIQLQINNNRVVAAQAQRVAISQSNTVTVPLTNPNISCHF